MFCSGARPRWGEREIGASSNHLSPQMNERTHETGFARRCPFPVGSWGLQSRPCPPPPLASWEGNRQPSALPAPNALGSLGALLAEEQRASRAGGNSPRHELAAAGDRSWGDAQIDRQIALSSPAPAPTFPTRRPPGAAQARRSPTPVLAPRPRPSAPPSPSFSRLGSLGQGPGIGKTHRAPYTLYTE